MRRALLAVIIALVACAPPPRPGPSISDPPVLPSPPPAGSPPASPAASPSPPGGRDLLFAVLEGPSGYPPLDDTIAITGLDGNARAKATFTPRARPFVGNAAPVLQPEARVAAGRVFFADGAGTVRSLAPSGEVRQVSAFPIASPQQELSFAVSPDGQSLAATIIRLPDRNPSGGVGNAFLPGPFHVDVEVAPSGQGARVVHRRDAPQEDPRGASLVMVGWGAGPLLTLESSLGTQQPPLARVNGKLELLAENGPSGQVLGGADCALADFSPELVACFDAPSHQLRIRRLVDGTPVDTVTVQGVAADVTLSADGKRVAFTDLGGPGASVRQLGAASTALPRGFRPAGWLDATTLIGTSAAGADPYSVNELYWLRLAQPERVEDLGFKGIFVGVVRAAP